MMHDTGFCGRGCHASSLDKLGRSRCIVASSLNGDAQISGDFVLRLRREACLVRAEFGAAELVTPAEYACRKLQ